MKKAYKKPLVKINRNLTGEKVETLDRRIVKIKAAKNIMLREIAGEYILIPVGEMAAKIHGMISLSESGCLLWKRIQEEATEGELVELILKEYAIDQKTATEDVKAFVVKMRRAGILEEEVGDEA